jgi:hypothetical protein
MLLVLALLLPAALADPTVLLILGGTDRIYIDGSAPGKVLDSFEAVGCPGGPLALPPYPHPLFAPLAAWTGDRLLVCGGADWQGAMAACHSWAPSAPGAWRPEPGLGSGRAFGALVEVEGGLVALGGVDTSRAGGDRQPSEVWYEGADG